MKLTTSVIPRRDGSVTVEDGDKKFVFNPDGSGELVCDVIGDALITRLLATEMFAPARVEDYDAAEALLDAAEAQKASTVGDGGSDDDDDDAEGDPNALPVEAATPPKKPVSHSKPRATRAPRVSN